ncbi:hypothetical protein D9M71_435120 [compost metagenome]
MQQHEVVDVADVMPRAQPVFDELVEGVQVDVGEELAAEVADRQAPVTRLADQALVLGHAVEQAGRAAQLVVLARVVHQDLQGQGAPFRFRDAVGQLLGEDALVDADEEVGQVALQVVRRPAPVLGDAAHLGLQALGGIEGAAAGDAGAAVGDEAALDARADVVVQQVVHDAIAEVGRPDLPRLRVGDHEADGGAGLVGAIGQLGMQLHEVALQVELEGQCAPAAALVAPAVQIGLHQGLERKFSTARCGSGCICGRHEPGSRCPCGRCSGCHHRSSGSTRCSGCTAPSRAIYVALPKAGADQRGNCAGPARHGAGGSLGAHGGGRIGQRHDQIQDRAGKSALTLKQRATLRHVSSTLWPAGPAGQ